MAFWDKYTWKQRLQALWVFIPLFCLLVYQLSIRPTLALWKQYRAGERATQTIQRDMQELADLQRRWRMSSGTYTAADSSFSSEKERLSALADLAGVRVLRLPEPDRFDEGRFSLSIVRSQYEGHFHQLLTLLHGVEQQTDIQVLNAGFVLRTNTLSRTPELQLDLNTYRISILKEDGK